MDYVISLCDLTGHMVLPWAENGYECHIVDIQHPAGISPHPLHPNIIRIGGSVYDKYLENFIKQNIIFAAFAFPPCTDLTGSGSRWWKGKGEQAYVDAMALLTRCRDLVGSIGCPWMLENPPGRINSGAGFDEPHPDRWEEKWDVRFQPFQFGGYHGSGRKFWEEHGAQLWRTFTIDHNLDPEKCMLQTAKRYTQWLYENFGIELSEDSDGYHKSTCLWTGNGFKLPRIKPIGLHAKADKIHKCPPGSERANIRSATPMGFARAVYEANQ